MEIVDLAPTKLQGERGFQTWGSQVVFFLAR